MFDATFNLLKDFVEHNEKSGSIDWEGDEAHKVGWAEMKELVNWYTEIRPNRDEVLEAKRPEPKVGFSKLFDNKFKDDPDVIVYRKYLDYRNEMDVQWEKEDEDKRQQGNPVRHAEGGKVKERGPGGEKDMPKVRQPGTGPEIADGDTQQRRRVYQPPLADYRYLKLNIYAQQGTAQIREDGVTQGGDAHGAEIAHQQHRPQPCRAVLTEHGGSGKGAQDNMGRVQGKKDCFGDACREVCQHNDEHEDNTGGGAKYGKGDVLLKLIDYAVKHHASSPAT